MIAPGPVMAPALSAAEAASTLTALAPIEALRSRYAEPWRHYHVWEHPQAMLAHLLQAEADGMAVADGAACVGFVLWHDAIYDPRSAHGRNELLSAELCAAEMAGLADPESIAHACAAIRATAAHRPLPGEACPDIALLLDIDLSILGAPVATFAVYDAAIRREYAHVAEAEYRQGRGAVLRRFLERDRLFLTDRGADLWEAPARTNLAAAIERLEDGRGAD